MLLNRKCYNFYIFSWNVQFSLSLLPIIVLLSCPLLASSRLNSLTSEEASAQEESFTFLFSSAVMGSFSVFFFFGKVGYAGLKNEQSKPIFCFPPLNPCPELSFKDWINSLQVMNLLFDPTHMFDYSST